MDQKRKEIQTIIRMLKARYVIKDKHTSARVRAALTNYNTKAEMLHSLSAVLSGEQNILNYLREKPDDTSPCVRKAAIDEKIQVLDDMWIFPRGKTLHIDTNEIPDPKRRAAIAAVRDILGRCRSTLEMDIITHDLIRGEITLRDWLVKHAA